MTDSPHPRSDAELIHAYRNGDAAAFRVLTERHCTSVYRLAYSFVHETAAAEDIAQETFVKAWRHLSAFDTRRSFPAWLLRIARNTAIDWIRTHQVTFSTEDLVIPDPRPPLDAALDARIHAYGVLAIVRRYSAGIRRMLELRYREELTFREIAEHLGKPLHTVKSQHRRTIAQLRTQIAPE
ncbi:sigma-70 family RNA polymerase sigma factor [Candidatus Uhrbacteria bacterium]|nr:sigma-70 family RNA polymerase sigma factor [Candidatus Uhrbacteria bacterium]